MSSQYGLGGKHSRVEAKQFVADHERGFLNKRPTMAESRYGVVQQPAHAIYIGFDRHKLGLLGSSQTLVESLGQPTADV
jgi:hypothetical protein